MNSPMPCVNLYWNGLRTWSGNRLVSRGKEGHRNRLTGWLLSVIR